tara:strand:+ start:2857 stop:3621 length:765 start_codon:yes stop_codon:yes gene_type:complete
MSPDNPQKPSPIAQARAWIANSRKLLFFVGAGLSKASGIKTFRDEDGLYQDRRVEELAHVDSFFHQREIMLSWYQHRRQQLLNVSPNEGHRALAAAAKTHDVVVATQNVDDLLERAQQNMQVTCPVWHVHGALAQVRCHDCGLAFNDLTLDLGTLPVCEACHGPLRPGVVWFGEALPPEPLQESFAAAQACEVCVLVGTSGVVYPAAMIPEQAAAAGARLIEVNPNTSGLSHLCDISIRGPADEILPQIFEGLN